MKKSISIITTCILLVTMAVGCGPKGNSKSTAASAENEKTKELKTKLDKEFTDSWGEDAFSGYVYISKKGTVLLDKGYGKADFDKGTDTTKQTKFDVASITKQFTATAIMQLQEKKLLDINDTVDKYIPTFPHGNQITIHQLLSHTSGLPEHPLDFDIRKFRPSYKDFGKDGKNENVKLTFEPGKGFLYSNTGYILLGYIVEKVSAKTLDSYFKKNIFTPLNMKNTGYKNPDGQLDNLATGYVSSTKEKAEKSWTFINVGSAVGSASLCTTVEDLIIWQKSLKEEKLLSKESYKKMYTPNQNYYGYGWYIFDASEGKKLYEHYGNASGYRSYIMRVPEDDTQVIIVSNYQDAPIDSIMSVIKEYLK